MCPNERRGTGNHRHPTEGLAPLLTVLKSTRCTVLAPHQRQRCSEFGGLVLLAVLRGPCHSWSHRCRRPDFTECTPACVGEGEICGRCSLSASASERPCVWEAFAFLPFGVPAGTPSWPWGAGRGTARCALILASLRARSPLLWLIQNKSLMNGQASDCPRACYCFTARSSSLTLTRNFVDPVLYYRFVLRAASCFQSSEMGVLEVSQTLLAFGRMRARLRSWTNVEMYYNTFLSLSFPFFFLMIKKVGEKCYLGILNNDSNKLFRW